MCGNSTLVDTCFRLRLVTHQVRELQLTIAETFKCSVEIALSYVSHQKNRCANKAPQTTENDNTVEPLYNGHPWDPKFCLRGVPISGASGIFPVGVVCVTGLLSTTWLRFQSFPLLYASRECYPEASTTSNSPNLMSSC